MNVIEIEERIDEILAQGFKPADFIFDFIEAYGAPKSVIKQLRVGQQDAFGQAPVLWRRNVHFQLASDGQVGRILNALAAHKDTEKQKVRYIISTDGHDFGARDMKSGESLNCLYDELGVHFGFFLPLAGIERYKIADENPVDIKATGRLAKFYDSILQDNPTWKGDEKRHALNHFITQVVFCLFGEDTGILPPSLFSETIATYCETDSTQAQKVLTDVFTAMSLPETARGDDCPTYARKFPHVNGGLFKGAPEVPRFTKGSVRYLIDASQLNWRDINPDIFGSMIQSIVNTDQRGELGMHYTSVPNILKVLDPLFLDDLREQVNANWNNKKGLHGILRRLSKIRVFDPACGSGNFLVIAYRELRAIEIKVINRLAEIDSYAPPLWSHVELTNFYGIEYADFAAETAKLSLWIAEYQMNSRYEDAFGKRTPALPLKETGNIVCGNALRVAWESVCPYTDDPEVETYIVGNPPYYGRQKRNDEQQDDMEIVFAKHVKNFGNLDYVCAWFLKGALHLTKSNSPIVFAFVATNSVSQGEQVALLWKPVFEIGCEIQFAHTSFKWSNLAGNNAGVTCIIVGVSKKSKNKKRLYTESVRLEVEKIGPYLTANNDTIVQPHLRPISKLPEMDYGSMANDGGHLILLPEELDSLLTGFPEAETLVRRIYGGQEFIRSVERYCLWITDEDLELARSIEPIERRIYSTKNARQSSPREATRKLASIPHKFSEIRHVDAKKLIIPNLSTDRREWFACGFLGERDVVIAPSLTVNNATYFDFAVISSKLHMVWLKAVCGRFKTDLRYSNTLGWNTFPLKEMSPDLKQQVEVCGQNILLARDTYFDKSIADLYQPKQMENDYPELFQAHKRNDEALEEAFFGAQVTDDQSRLEALLSLYRERSK